MAVAELSCRHHQPAARPAAVQPPPPHQQQQQQQQQRRRPTPADLQAFEREEMEARDVIFGGASCRRLSLTDGPHRAAGSFAGSTPRLGGGRPGGGGGSASSGGSRSHAAALAGFPAGAFAAQHASLGLVGGSLPMPVGAHAMSFSAVGARPHHQGPASAGAADGPAIASCSQDSFFNPLRRVSLPVKGQAPRSFEELRAAAGQFGGGGSPGAEAARRAPHSLGDLRQSAAIAAQ